MKTRVHTHLGPSSACRPITGLTRFLAYHPSLRYLADRDEPPQRDQQLASQSHDCNRRFFAGGDPCPIPLYQRTIRLIHQKAPGELDHPTTYSRITRFGQPLLAPTPTTLVRRAGQPSVSRNSALISVLPRKDFAREHICGLDAQTLDPYQVLNPVIMSGLRRVMQLSEALVFYLFDLFIYEA